MDFGERFRRLRCERGLTQDEVAAKLNISRQAVSNWENDKNLPDIELLIELAESFGLSLDQMILGDKSVNNMTEKLIKDGGDTRRAKLNLASVIVGAALLLIGAGCIFLKAASVEYIDAAGFLHENFFLLPIGFFFMFCGLITFAATGIASLVRNIKGRRKQKHTES